MTRSAIQLYTLRNVNLPFDQLLERVSDAGFDGVEFTYRVTDEEPAAVAETLAETGLEAVGAHVGVEALEEGFEETVDFYELIDCDDVVVPWLGEHNFESLEAVDAAASRLGELDDRLADRGMDFHYHNHDHEYTDLNGRTGFDAFVDATDFGIELDLGLSLAAGDDVIARLRSLGTRSRLIHLKDFDVESGESVPVGEGDLDLAEISDVIAEDDSDWLIYEYEGEDPLASLDDAADTVRELC